MNRTSDPTARRYRAWALNIGADLLGGLLVALGIRLFTAPNEIAPGGVTGLATIFNHLFGLPIGGLILGLNLPVFALGWKSEGRTYVLRSLLSTGILTLMVDVVCRPVPPYEGNPLLAALFGGVLMGAGVSLIFLRNSSTGGTDILSRALVRRFPHISIGKFMMGIDLLVVLTGIMVYRNIEAGLYAVITIFVATRVVDGILCGVEEGRLVFVVSSKAEEIAGEVLSHLARGVTLFKTVGAYSGREGHTLLCGVGKVEYFRLKQIVHRVDPDAFMISATAGQILGEGFRPILDRSDQRKERTDG
ncbi:MAG: YitT family protein [Oscillospiraceae bacterium]|nr:YitT family protein [Oscillospiraceae bacterium]